MHRKTNQREAILKVLKGNRSHPTADSIYDNVRSRIPNISKGTVYRNLKVLENMGEIRAIILNGTASRYEEACTNHYHFRCDNCGKVMDLDEPIHHDLDSKVAKKTGLKITCHQMEFRGLCHECQNGKPEKNPFKSRKS